MAPLKFVESTNEKLWTWDTELKTIVDIHPGTASKLVKFKAADDYRIS